jgi:ABC-3C biological conflict system middle component
MIQLTYEPAFDTFHTVFRLLRLRPIITVTGQIYRDHLRIIDFYQLFPYRIQEIRLKPAHRRFRTLAHTYATKRPYGEPPDGRLLFERMSGLQLTALDTLASLGFIKSEQWERGEIAATGAPLPDVLAARINDLNQTEAELESFLTVLAAEYELTGPNGLKARTGLMEYRQDAL